MTSGRTHLYGRARSFAQATARHAWLLTIFTLALALRVAYLQGSLPLLEARQTPIYGDAASFRYAGAQLADWIASGGSQGALALQDDARERLWIIGSTRGPGYIAFLGGSFAVFGSDPWVVRYLQALLDSLTCAIVALVARELGGRLAGITGGALAVVYPTSILFTGRILTETLATFLLSAGLLALLLGRRRSEPRLQVAAGLLIAGAALTRPTLLAAVPLLVIAALLPSGATTGRAQLRLGAVFAVAALVPLLIWGGVASLAEAQPIAGARGFEHVSSMMQSATLPRYRGWHTDDLGLLQLYHRGPDDFHSLARARPLYVPVAVGNLIFHHVWFLENLWREVPEGLHAFQRLIFLLALGGAGVALVRWREFSPILLLLVGLAVCSSKWIEIRPILVFLPILFVLAGVCLATLRVQIASHPQRGRLAGVSVLALLGTAVGLSASPISLAPLLPALEPLTLGALADVLRIALAGVWAFVAFALLRPAEGNLRAGVIAAVPALLFGFLYGSYAFVGSQPRWLAFSIDLARTGCSASQRLALPGPVEADAIERALWLVDLETTANPPALSASVDGRTLTGPPSPWRRLFCSDSIDVPRDRFQQRNERIYCQSYRGISQFTGELERSPQWWGLEIDPGLLDGARETTLTLSPSDAQPPRSTEQRLRIGGRLSSGKADDYYGPSLDGFTPTGGTSLYRWHVANDWRLWTETRLASTGSASRVCEGDPRDRRPKTISSLLSRQQAELNIRLLVQYLDGRREIF